MIGSRMHIFLSIDARRFTLDLRLASGLRCLDEHNDISMSRCLAQHTDHQRRHNLCRSHVDHVCAAHDTSLELHSLFCPPSVHDCGYGVAGAWSGGCGLASGGRVQAAVA